MSPQSATTWKQNLNSTEWRLRKEQLHGAIQTSLANDAWKKSRTSHEPSRQNWPVRVSRAFTNSFSLHSTPVTTEMFPSPDSFFQLDWKVFFPELIFDIIATIDLKRISSLTIALNKYQLFNGYRLFKITKLNYINTCNLGYPFYSKHPKSIHFLCISFISNRLYKPTIIFRLITLFSCAYPMRRPCTILVHMPMH